MLQPVSIDQPVILRIVCDIYGPMTQNGVRITQCLSPLFGIWVVASINTTVWWLISHFQKKILETLVQTLLKILFHFLFNEF
jgi:hypothetical protein